MNGEIPLSTFATGLIRSSEINDSAVCTTALASELMNGKATDFVYSTLSLDERREHGVFFSGASWARKILSGQDLTRWRRYVDPSVGVGDLLLEVCKTLPLAGSANDTIELWALRLVAVDLRKSFLEIAWLRIQALAIHRHATEKNQTSKLTFKKLPKNFITGDILSIDIGLKERDCVIMNPPYQRIQARPNSFVGKGKKSAAALHIEHIFTQAPQNTGVFALVPDVLRSGSSYSKFRKFIRSSAEIHSFKPCGAFGIHADVDVAILVITTKTQENSDSTLPSCSTECVEDYFSVSVGPVVPHRTPTTGTPRGYLTAKNAKIGETISKPAEFANYECRLEKGPFVIVRRTSSPSDKKRARTSLVACSNEFLIENHLLVLKPKDGKLSTCQSLIKIMDSPESDKWLNDNMRCRHLTVGSIKQLPWLKI